MKQFHKSNRLCPSVLFVDLEISMWKENLTETFGKSEELRGRVTKRVTFSNAFMFTTC